MTPFSITDLASALVDRTRAARAAGQTKVAAAPAPIEHPLAQALKQAAEALRSAPDEGVSMDAVMKVANAIQPGTGAQSPSAGGAAGTTPPKLPGLQTSNLGVVAGGGGAGETLKQASSTLGTELRKLAADLRAEAAEDARLELEKAAHVLNAAVAMAHLQKVGNLAQQMASQTQHALPHGAHGLSLRGAGIGAAGLGALGAGVGAMQADEGQRMQGALKGGLAGAAVGGLGGALHQHLNPEDIALLAGA